MWKIDMKMIVGKFTLSQILQEMDKLGFNKNISIESTSCYDCSGNCNRFRNPRDIETSVLDYKNIIKRVRICTEQCYEE